MPRSDALPPLAIEHLADRGRFQIVIDGASCELDYRLAAGVMTIHHTGVAPRLEGRGIAGALMCAALEHARTAGWKVRPLCSYARAYMQRHPKTGELLA
jgi:predicted GNAT family acetyltransferase